MKYLLLAVLTGSGILVAVRGFGGAHSPMNVEGVFALSFLALLLVRSTGTKMQSESFRPVFALVLAAAVAAGFAGYLGFPFLADDYSHIWNAHHPGLLAHLTVPEEDHFFRPAGYFSYALDAVWAGFSPRAWRAANLALHLANCVLVFALCLEVGTTRLAALGGALLFGLHGSRPEAVTWVAARFDLLAVLFGVACLIGVLRGVRVWVSLPFLLAAVWSKESAYIIPFVIAAVLIYRGQRWREVAVRLWPLIALEVVTFSYRTWLLQGIGGYHDATTGKPTIFNFGFASTLKAVFVRFWAVMIFPLNWTGGLNPVLATLLALAVMAMGYLAWRGADRRKVWLGLAIAMLCALPVQQFLSIGADLEKSRVLYMASIGLAILFAALLEGATGWLAYGSAATVMLFQIAALESNLAVWKRVSFIAERACVAGAAAGLPVEAEGLPNVLDGVYFLHTGFPECVLFQTAVARASQEKHVLVWNGASRVLEPRQ